MDIEGIIGELETKRQSIRKFLARHPEHEETFWQFMELGYASGRVEFQTVYKAWAEEVGAPAASSHTKPWVDQELERRGIK